MLQNLSEKKKSGKELSKEEIESIVSYFHSGIISENEMADFLHLVYKHGLSFKETRFLTEAEVNTGSVIEWPKHLRPIVDKHSTGGVGDKVSLVVVPWVASTGVRVSKLSGRSLGHTGGTIDKLRSIPGFNFELSSEEFVSVVEKVGCAIAEPFHDLCPVEKKIYDLRNKTSTIDSIPLIAASILSKKIAAGADSLVFDVKVGNGAFLKTLEDAKLLSNYLIEVASGFERKAVCVLTSMDEPLGYAIGNSLEVREAIDFLSGKDIPDLYEVSLEISLNMLSTAGIGRDEAKKLLEVSRTQKKALKKFLEMVEAQGGPGDLNELKRKLPHARIVGEFTSKERGYIASIDPILISKASRKTSPKPDAVETGIVLLKKVGDEVEVDEPLAEIHAANYEALDEVADILENAFLITEEKVEKRSKVMDIIS